MDAHRVGENVGEHLVLDHLRRHAHQGQGVAVVAAFVAGDVERADHLAMRIEDRRAGAGQDLVGIQVMVRPMNHHRLLLGQRGADRVGAFAALGPADAGHERDARGLLEEIAVAERMQDQAFLVGQQHHAVGVGDLLVQRLHHRRGMLVEEAVLLERGVELGPGCQREVGAVTVRESEALRSLVREPDHGLVLGNVGGVRPPDSGRTAQGRRLNRAHR